MADDGFVAVVGEMASRSRPRRRAPRSSRFWREVEAIADVPAPDLAYEMNLRYRRHRRWRARGSRGGRSSRVETAAATVSRGEQLGAAVRLTGQAFQAWMSVLQQTTPGRPRSALNGPGLRSRVPKNGGATADPTAVASLALVPGLRGERYSGPKSFGSAGSSSYRPHGGSRGRGRR